MDVLCLDEFQVVHVGDALILKWLFETFFNNHITCIFTSNRPPEDLYKNGLQWNLFLPFIDLLKQKASILTLGGVDYRLQGTTLNDVYITPINGETQKKMSILWSKLTEDKPVDHKICQAAYGKTVWIHEYVNGVGWMTFDSLCNADLSNSDYQALCANIHTLVLTNVP